jgi:hypothetical protein
LQAPGNWLNYNRYGYCLNNPFLYTDPTGEIFVIDDLIIAMAISSVMNLHMQNMAGNLKSSGDAWKALGVGALAGAAGYGASTLVVTAIAPVGAIGGGLTGAAGGVAGGFVGSTGNAWTNGANFKDGLKAGLTGSAWGALGGGILGGINGGITAHKHGGNLLTGEGARFTSDFLGTDITEAKNASINTDEQILKLLDEKGVNFSELNVNSVSIEGEVTIPESIPNLMITMNHEFIHAYQFAQFGYTNLTEWNAFKETSAHLNTQLYKPLTQVPAYSGQLWVRHLYNWPKLPSVY